MTDNNEQEKRLLAMQEVDKINQETLFTIQIQLGIMRDENKQILDLVQGAYAKLTDNFHQIGLLTHQMSVEPSPQAAEAVQTQVNQAITTLQFEDMCSQLVNHVDKRMDALTELTQVIAAMSFFELDLDNLEQYQSQLVYAKQLASQLGAAMQSTAHNPVSQHNLDSGDIELF
jgi:methyl-accepting chemotaxis protein